MMSAKTMTPPPVRNREIGGMTWRYSVVGEGRQGLLILPGALGGGEISRCLLPRLEDYRILTLTYPAVESLDVLMRGLEEILTTEGMDQVDVFGGSFGGMMAQCFARRAPARVRRLVLQGTAVPDPARAPKNERFLRVARFVPMGVFRLLLRLVIRLVLRKMPSAERGYWVACYDREIRSLIRPELASRYRLSIDFDRNSRFLTEGLQGWPISILMLEGGDDKIANSDQRDQLKALYPEARVHTFEGVGHGMSLLRPEEWARVIATFLTEDGLTEDGLTQNGLTQNGESPVESK